MVKYLIFFGVDIKDTENVNNGNKFLFSGETQVLFGQNKCVGVLEERVGKGEVLMFNST
jgi:hypothetical protein